MVDCYELMDGMTDFLQYVAIALQLDNTEEFLTTGQRVILGKVYLYVDSLLQGIYDTKFVSRPKIRNKQNCQSGNYYYTQAEKKLEWLVSAMSTEYADYSYILAGYLNELRIEDSLQS